MGGARTSTVSYLAMAAAVTGIVLAAAASVLSLSAPSAAISGLVVDANGPVAGATVRVQATDNVTVSDADGAFTLSGLESGSIVTVTAWAPGFYVAGTEAVADGAPVTITLKRHYTTDNPDYGWFSAEAVDGSRSCSQCMPAFYEQWQADAHSQSAVNPRFLTMYNGTDVHGNASPPTRYIHSRDYGRFPLRPDPTQPYFGPGYKLDFPDSAGNCATCHVPGAAAGSDGAYAADANAATGIAREGVFCEFCHKVGAVTLDPETDLPYPNMTGVLSMRLYRPVEGEQLFFGTLDDVTRRVSYLPLEAESAFCAPCHHAVFWDTVIYNSYGEWLASPYSDLETGQTCQACHMPATDATTIVLPSEGGLERPPGRVHDHRMPGAMDETLLQNAVTMTVAAARQGGQVTVDVTIVNDQTGHHVPTGSPLRHLILLIEAADAAGRPLVLADGSRVPEWGGIGDPNDGDYAGRPGKAFARVLEELWTEISPSGAYWNPTRVISDNRLAAFAVDTSRYTFEMPEAGPVAVEATLLFRRAFIDLARQKGWDTPDIVMERETIRLDAE